jgi:hypothetical protein
MFDSTSRYYPIEQATIDIRDDRTVTYVRRRFLPRGESLPLLVTLTVADGDRLDLIAARTIGNAAHFWRICDANNAMLPKHLTEEPGRVLRIAIPQVIA